MISSEIRNYLVTIQLKEIDENIEVWILGNENASLFKDILKRLSNNTISNPIDNSPLQINNELKHLAVVYYNRKESDDKVKDKIVYGNQDGSLYEFASCVIKKIRELFPQDNSNYKNILMESKLH